MKLSIRDAENGWIVESEIDGTPVETLFVFEEGCSGPSPSTAFMYLLYHIIEQIGPHEAKDGFSKEYIYVNLGPGDEVDTSAAE